MVVRGGGFIKNVINYYYQMNLENIHLVRGVYHFTYLNQSYLFFPVFQDAPSILSLSSFLKKNFDAQSFYHKIIFTKEGNPYLFLDNRLYVLLLVSPVVNDQISFYDIKYYPVFEKNTALVRFPWQNFWIQKCDYFENFLFHLERKFSKILPICYYFLGMAENSIQYVQSASTRRKDERDSFVVSHRRIDVRMSVVDFYNPFTIVIDNPARDISEYLKSSFFHGDYSFLEIEDYLNSIHFSDYGYSLLFGRLMYPSFFFDCCDHALDAEKIDDVEILKLSSRMEEYRIFLKQIYFMIRKRSDIEEVRWITR